ncbi:cell division protein FtsZ [Agriterribacter sp.]|uniref:cell division protein FtsZ n=1 Tax=Agriterribacter sp. TaxID=2821509 RepID=UPI002C415DCB|nr:cell division protein FtsZ [Agriterribacter sp.]HTN06695.1 cell division protein FtsZ [Agriterribacter sp.]
MIHFDLPKEKSSIIKVIGVGGGGSNAVNYMFGQDIEGVNFIICNTDAQALALSKVPNKVQLGPMLTQGLGAGANPDIGRQATEESLEEIRRILEVNTKMAFITAGMGGGTGTGGAPILAKICKDLGILTVGIVTTPFAYEGKKRFAQAEEGITKLKDYVDTLLVISNDKMRHQYGNLTMRAAFSKADNVLATAAKCITDVINTTGQINVDFADVCTVMRNGGVAILGSATADGESRAQKAIQDAINSPLLNDNDISGAKWILININSAEGDTEFTMDEVDTIQNYLLSQAGEHTNVIMGLGYDNSLGDKIGITLIATGFENKDAINDPVEQKEQGKEEKILLTLSGNEPKQPAPAVVVEAIADPMAPQIIEVAETRNFMDITAASPSIEKVKNEEKEILNLSITSLPSSPSITIETHTTHSPAGTEPVISKVDHYTIFNKEASTTPTSGGYLSKPSNIYAEEPDHLQSKTNNPVEEPSPLLSNAPTDGKVNEMQMVIKDPNAANGPVARSTQSESYSAEEPAMQDEAEDQKRRAAERLNKLRNLSYNVNAADSNNEFETVPAYVRRNFHLKDALTSVEKFYSNYTVKTDENDQTQISTINTFLDGKKPD